MSLLLSRLTTACLLALATLFSARPVPAADAAAAGSAKLAWELVRASGDGNAILSPASVWEALAMTHAGARGETAAEIAAVLGMPDDRLGEVPVCAVELRPGATAPSEAELDAFCREHLLPYQVPVKFRVVDALPRTVSMKVDRPATRALFA